ncbi:MAG: anti-sigma factor [Burkholderiaceae bacterium]
MTSKDQGILIAEYTLGLLNQQEMAQAHALLGRDAQAAAQALDWEQGFLELTDLLTPVDPSPLLLAKIQTSLGHDTTPGPSSLYRRPAHNPPAEPAAQASLPTTSRKKRHHQPTPERIRNEPTLSAAPNDDVLPETSHDAAFTATTATPPPNGNNDIGMHAGGNNGSDSIGIHGNGVDGNIRADSDSHDAGHSRASAQAARYESSVAEAAGNAATASASFPVEHAKAAAPSSTTKAESPQPPSREKPASMAGNIWIWRGASVAFAVIALALALMPAKPVPPAIKVVEVAPTQAAILQAPGQSSTPGWVLTVDPQQNVLLDPQVRSDIPATASVQLWTHNASMPQPRSLGLIDPNKPVTVPAALMGGVGPDQIFEMTQEPAGGSPTASPTGPVLFIGRIVTFGKKQPPAAGPATDPASRPGANS